MSEKYPLSKGVEFLLIHFLLSKCYSSKSLVLEILSTLANAQAIFVAASEFLVLRTSLLM